MRTEEALGVSLTSGEEVDGFEVAGLWASGYPEVGHPTPPLELWPEGTEADVWRMHGPGWVVQLWRLRLRTWPAASAWRGLVEATLNRMSAHGASIAWMANDHTFADPPSLFDQEAMGDMVFAALSSVTGFVCAAQVGQPVAWLPSIVQDQLHAEAKRLVDLRLADPDDPHP